MRCFLLLCVGSGLLLEQRRSASRGGIEDVIKLLKEMLGSFNDQSKEDKDNWSKYSTWSEAEESDRTAFVQNQEGVVMSATAQLNAQKQNEQTLTGQLSELATEIAQIEESMRELNQLRGDEHKAHQDDLADLTKTIEATNKAVEVLEGHYAAAGVSAAQVKQDVTHALSALALAGRYKAPQQLSALLASPDWLATDGGAAYGEYKGVAAEGGGVVGTLKSIRTTLLDNKQDSIERENEAQRQFETAKSAKETDLARNRDEQATKQNSLTEAQALIQQHTATIGQATSDISDAQEYLKVLKLDREHFGNEFNKRATTREGESTATQAALDALQEVSVSFVQRSALSFAKGLVACPKCKAAVAKLLQVGQASHSAQLVQLSTAMETTLRGSSKSPQAFYDPEAMAPVTNLLKQLIGKLEEELRAETSHHEWCETEKTTSAAAKVEREKNIEELSAEIEQLTTKIAQLNTDISFLGSELVRVRTETETATSLRAQEKATFEEAKKEHDTVIAALEKAMGSLSQYALAQVKHSVRHAHLAKASFIQTRQRSDPGFSDYASGAGAGGSAVDMLQDLLNRYSGARTQLIQAEAQGVAAFEQLLERNAQFRKDTEQAKQAKEVENRQAGERLANARIELSDNRKQLSEINTYIADLKPSCDDIRSTFEERKERREAEIAALKETLAVLQDPSTMR